MSENKEMSVWILFPILFKIVHSVSLLLTINLREWIERDKTAGKEHADNDGVCGTVICRITFWACLKVDTTSRDG